MSDKHIIPFTIGDTVVRIERADDNEGVVKWALCEYEIIEMPVDVNGTWIFAICTKGVNLDRCLLCHTDMIICNTTAIDNTGVVLTDKEFLLTDNIRERVTAWLTVVNG